jgi:hypothetical protein
MYSIVVVVINVKEETMVDSQFAARTQITTVKAFNPLQIYPADEKSTRTVLLLLL